MKKTKKMKRFFSMLLAVSVIYIMGAGSVSAYDTWYDGWIGGNGWTWIGRQNIKQNYKPHSYVKEVSTNKKPHKTYYKITNSDDIRRGEVALGKYEKGVWVAFKSNCVYGYGYYLDARLEWNPFSKAANVKGYYES